MIEWLMGIYKTYSEFTSSNQMLGAVVAGLIMSSLVIVFRSIPEKIYKLIYNRIISSTQFNSEVDWMQREACKSLLVWGDKHKHIFYSRSSLPSFTDEAIGPNGTTVHVLKLGIGVGKNLIKYKEKLYIMDVSLEKSSETLKFNFNVTLKCFWFQAKDLENILTDLFKEKETDTVSIYEMTASEWKKTNVPMRYLNTVITTGFIGEKIVDICNEFTKDKEWYYKTGISYKLGICLHGEPGTGKTSLVKALATELNRKLYTLNIGTVTDGGFIRVIREIPPGSILSLEDIDCAGSTGIRETVKTKEKDVKEPSLSLSTILNVLDGVVPLNDVIVVMSTNHVSKIDPAILRKGRTDFSIEIKPLDSDAVSRFSQLIYGVPVRFYGKIKGCDLQHLVIENKRNFEGFSKALKTFEDIKSFEDNKPFNELVTDVVNYAHRNQFEMES